MSIEVRHERPEDERAIRAVNAAAFDAPGEADLVDLLRRHATPVVSLVADDAGEMVGHILFSPVTLPAPSPLILGLAPMSVVPSRQRRGIGSALVRAGLQRCRELHAIAVVVVGHPEYYPRFGFVPASTFGLTCEYDVPDDVFMALELEQGSLQGRSGRIRYHEAFGQA